MIKNIKKTVAVLTVTAIGLSACAKNPEESVIVNKDIDKMVEKAQDESGMNLSEMGEVYSTSKPDNADENVVDDSNNYKNSFTDEKLRVSIDINAPVDIPDAQKMSLLRVEKGQNSIELVRKIRDELVGEDKLYDYYKACEPTKKELLRDITAYANMIQEVDENYQQYISECGEEEYQHLKEQYETLQKAYETAPESYTFSEDYVISDDFINVAKMHEQFPDDEEWENHYECDNTKSIYAGVTDCSDNNFENFYAQNSENDGASIQYRRSTHGYERLGSPTLNMIEKKWKGDTATEVNLRQFMSSENGEPLKPVCNGGIDYNATVIF